MAIWDTPIVSLDARIPIPESFPAKEVKAHIRNILNQFGWIYSEKQAGFDARTPVDLKRIAGEDILIAIENSSIYIKSSGHNINALTFKVGGNQGINALNQENIQKIQSAINSIFNLNIQIDTAEFIKKLSLEHSMLSMGIIDIQKFNLEKIHMLSGIKKHTLDMNPIDFLGNIAPLISHGIITLDELIAIKAEILC